MITLRRMSSCLLLGSLLALSACSGGSTEQESSDATFFTTEPPVDTHVEADQSVAAAKVLTQIDVPRLGSLTIIDEDPALEQPQLGVLWVYAADDTLDLPLTHGDGTAITPYEYLLSLSPDAAVPQRIVVQHDVARNGAAPLPVTPKALLTGHGTCDSSGSAWRLYFNSRAHDLGANVVGTPQHNYNQTTTVPTFTWYGNLASYSNIIAGTCFRSQGDGRDDLRVTMQRRIGSGSWSDISGTMVTLKSLGSNATNYYVYSSTSVACSIYQRRIRIEGHPTGDAFAPDVFHASGAWGGLAGCNLGS